MSEDKVEYRAGAVVKESLTVGRHHPTGMSKFPALAQCPFYENDGGNDGKTELRNDGKDGYAEAGQEAHGLLALAMRGEPCPVDSPHYGAVMWAAEWARCTEDLWFMPFDVERMVTMKSELPHVDGVFGTADLCMVVNDAGNDGKGKRIIVADFKTFGTGEKCHVEQLAGYAFALGCGHGVTDPGTPCELYELHGKAWFVKRYDMTLGDCHAMVVKILTAVDEARRHDAAVADVYNMGGCPNCSKNIGRGERTGLPVCSDGLDYPTGECFVWRGHDSHPTQSRCANEYCRYCKHYGPCEAQGALVAAVVPATVPNANLLTATREEMLARPQDIPVMLVLVKELETLIDRAKENAREVIVAHGVRSEDGAGLCSWTLEDEARGVAWEIKQSQGARRLCDLLGLYHGYASTHLTQEEFLENCTAQFGRLAKAIHAKTGIPMREVEASIGEYAERGEMRETMKRVK